MSLTEMERIAGFSEPPENVIIALPLRLDLFNKLLEESIRERVDIKQKIARILDEATA